MAKNQPGGIDSVVDKFTSLSGILEAFGQSAQEASSNAQAFADSAATSRQAMHVFSSLLPKDMGQLGETAKDVMHSFKEFGPEVGGVIAVMQIMKATFEAQTEAVKDNAQMLNNVSAALKSVRYFLDDVKDSAIKQQFDKLAIEGEKLREQQIRASSLWGKFADWWMGTSEANKSMREYTQTALSRAAGRLTERATEIGDTGTEQLHVGQVGGAGNRAVGARELGAYSIDHQTAMVAYLAQIASNTAGIGAPSLGNPNSSFTGNTGTVPVRGVGTAASVAAGNIPGRSQSSGGDFGPVQSSSGGDFGQMGESSGGDFGASVGPEKPPAPPEGF